VLALTEARGEDLETEIGQLRATLDEGRAENARLDALASSLEAERDALAARASRFEDRIAALIAERDAALGEVATLEEQADAQDRALTQARAQITRLDAARTRAISEQEALQLALARLRDEIDAEAEAAREAAARADALQALAESLRAERDDAEAQVSELSDDLTQAERQRLIEAAAAEALRDRLENADAELTAMSLILEEERREAEATLEKLAAAEAARRDLSLELDETADALDRERALLAVARNTIADQSDLNTTQARNLAALNAQTRELRRQMAALSRQLELAETADEEAQVEIAALGRRLNAALAREASVQRREAQIQRQEAEIQAREAEVARAEAERLRRENSDLASYRSEFFGRMREILAGREDIRIVGDRFLFQSEVLFDFGSAELGAEGRAELGRLAAAIREVAPEAPEGIDWILRVDGHTDDVGPSSANWELSQERALAVVEYLIEEQGIPPRRLSANAFGEYQPLDTADTEEARARNRRIEVKFTER
jgi:chemotaxis protein MotB